MRLDVYQAQVAAQKNIKDSGEWEKLSPEQQRLIDKMVSSSSTTAAQLSMGITDFGWNSRRPCFARGAEE
jgi:hypothetical protein